MLTKTLALIAAVSLGGTAARAGDLTVEQCLSILSGLNALNCAGEQLGGTCPTDAKQYKLGGARMTIALGISALGQVSSAYQRAVQGYAAELPRIPAAEPGKPDRNADARAQQNRDFAAFQVQALAKPCGVEPGHLRAADLKIGDGADDNAIPPSVIGALAPIIDK